MFTQAVDEIAPMKDIRIKYRTEEWMNEDILNLMQTRDKALSISNKNKHDIELRKAYNKLRNKVTRLIKKTKANYFHDKVEEHKDNPKRLWKQFKTIGYSNKNKEKTSIVLEIENEKCFDSKKVANHMNNFYLTIASTLQNQITNVQKIFDTCQLYLKTTIETKELFQKVLKYHKYPRSLSIKNYAN